MDGSTKSIFFNQINFLMKKLLLSSAVAMLFWFAGAQGTVQDSKSKATEPAKKESRKHKKGEHVCTAACKGDQHALAHGEKGHKCTVVCHKKM